MTSDTRTVVISRDVLNEISGLLLHNVIQDPRQRRAVRDEASCLLFYLSDMLCHFGRRGDKCPRNVPSAMDVPQFYTNDLELLLRDLYPNGEPEDIRSIVIMLARRAAADVDDGLLTLDCRLEHLATLDSLIASIREDARDDDEDETDEETEQYERSTNGAH